jgi:hypothetical protein
VAEIRRSYVIKNTNLIFRSAYGILIFFLILIDRTRRWVMNMQAILHDIETLPPERQEEAADFIAFLKTRLGIQEGQSLDTSTSTYSDSFFGMWADREEMKDSALCVRKLRNVEWRAQDA